LTRIAAVAEALKGNPLALALVVVNAMFLIGGVYILRDVNETMREREVRNTQLFRECIDARRG
jgi:hypothetical protein